jgi:hypothetical protein
LATTGKLMMKKKGSRIGMAEVEGCLLKNGSFIINFT